MAKTIEEIIKDLRERQKENQKRENAGNEQDKVVMEGSRQELVETEMILENDFCEMISESAWIVLRKAHEDENN